MPARRANRASWTRPLPAATIKNALISCIPCMPRIREAASASASNEPKQFRGVRASVFSTTLRSRVRQRAETDIPPSRPSAVAPRRSAAKPGSCHETSLVSDYLSRSGCTCAPTRRPGTSAPLRNAQWSGGVRRPVSTAFAESNRRQIDRLRWLVVRLEGPCWGAPARRLDNGGYPGRRGSGVARPHRIE